MIVLNRVVVNVKWDVKHEVLDMRPGRGSVNGSGQWSGGLVFWCIHTMDYPAGTENHDTHVCLFTGAHAQGMLSNEKKNRKESESKLWKFIRPNV